MAKASKKTSAIAPNKKQPLAWKTWFPLLIVVLLFVGGTTNGLGKFMTTDETVWLYQRIPKYFNGWKTAQYEDTRITDNPGVLHSLLAGLTYSPRDLVRSKNQHKMVELLATWRMPMVLFTVFCLVLMFVLIRKLWGDAVASLSVAFMVSYPYIFGISRIVNSDTTVWSTCFVAFLFLWLSLEKGRRRNAIYSGLFLGLGLLSKYNAAMLYLFSFLVWYTFYLVGRKNYTESLRGLQSVGIMWLMSFVPIIVLMPACWLDPSLLWIHGLGIILKSPLVYAAFVLPLLHFGIARQNWESITQRIAMGTILSQTVTYILALVTFVFLGYLLTTGQNLALATGQSQGQVAAFAALMNNTERLTLTFNWPLALFFIALPFIWIFPSTRAKVKNYATELFICLFFALFFVAGSSVLGFLLGGRYLLMIYPFLFLALAICIKALLDQKWFLGYTLVALAFVDVVLLFPQSELTYQTNIHFRDNNHPLTWGFGGYELAQKANTLPGADTLTILTDYHGFEEFFVGNTSYMDRQVTDAEMAKYDYLALSYSGRRQKKRWGMYTPDLNYYYELPPEQNTFSVGNAASRVRLVKIDKTRHFTAPENYFDTDLYLNTQENFSVTVWISSANLQSGALWQLANKTGEHFGLTVADQNIQLTLPTDTLNFATEQPLNTNTWQHITLLKRTKGAQLFINGQALANSDTLVLANFSKMLINNRFSGRNQDMRVYNHALTQAQIDAIYNQGEITVNPKLIANGKVFPTFMHFTKN